MTVIPRIRRVLIGAQAHAEIAARVRAARPDLAVASAVSGDVTDAMLADADAYVGFRRPQQATSMGTVRWVHCTGAGVDGWLGGAPLPADILLTRSAESFGPMIAEWALARMFAVQQQLLPLAQAQAERRWAPLDPVPLAGTRALLVGAGDIGAAIARRLVALDVRVTAVSRSGVARDPALGAVRTPEALPALVADADWIVVTLPLTPETRGLVSGAVLARARGAVLVNAGRGAVVEESAIVPALDAGHLRAAALDVFEEEPLPAGSPLWGDPRVLVSPHISGLTTVAGAADGFVACLAELDRGLVPRWAVDRERGY